MQEPKLESFYYIYNYLGLKPSRYFHSDGDVTLTIEISNACWYAEIWFKSDYYLPKSMYLFLLLNLKRAGKRLMSERRNIHFKLQQY